MPVETAVALPKVQRFPAGGFVVVNPRFAGRLLLHRLKSPTQFIDLPGEVISGHRDRHVVAVEPRGLNAILKREHRVPWGQRFRNWWAGFGWSSLSEREARCLTRLRESGVSAPNWLAYGEDGQGRAFVLLDRIRGIPLVRALQPGRLSEFARAELADQLGAEVARLCLSGFDAPDLSAKHVLVRKDTLSLLDWPRARAGRELHAVTGSLTALAQLHASVPAELATLRERLRVVRGFLRAAGLEYPTAKVALDVAGRAIKLGFRRSLQAQVRETRRPNQRLRWLDGEAICATAASGMKTRADVPQWFVEMSREVVTRPIHTRLKWSGAQRAWNFQLPPLPRWRRWLSWLVRPRPSTTELAGMAFRLERLGVPIPKVLAFGQRSDGGGFLFARALRGDVPLAQWLSQAQPVRETILHRMGQIVRLVHAAKVKNLDACHLMLTNAASRNPRLHVLVDGHLRYGELSLFQVTMQLSDLLWSLGLNENYDREWVVRGYLESGDPGNWGPWLRRNLKRSRR